MKILVDMNLSPGWVNFLVEAGFDAVHWSQVGSSNAPDSELMQWAAERNCIVLTADLDFGAILAATQLTRPSVIQVRSGLLIYYPPRNRWHGGISYSANPPGTA